MERKLESGYKYQKKCAMRGSINIRKTRNLTQVNFYINIEITVKTLNGMSSTWFA